MTENTATTILVQPVAEDAPATATEWAAKLLGGYTELELAEAFEAVRPGNHWKDPIRDARVAVADLQRTLFAITFYTGNNLADGSVSIRTLASAGDVLLVSTKGYYHSIGA